MCAFISLHNLGRLFGQNWHINNFSLAFYHLVPGQESFWIKRIKWSEMCVRYDPQEQASIYSYCLCYATFLVDVFARALGVSSVPPVLFPPIVFLHKKSWPDKVLHAVKIMPCLYVFISSWQFNYFWPHWRKPHDKLPAFTQILIRNAGKLKQSCFEMLSFFPGLALELCLNQHKRK